MREGKGMVGEIDASSCRKVPSWEKKRSYSPCHDGKRRSERKKNTTRKAQAMRKKTAKHGLW